MTGLPRDKDKVRIFPDARFLAAALTTRGLATDLFEAVLLGHDFVTGTCTLSRTERLLRVILGPGSTVPAEAVEMLCSQADLVAVTAPSAEVPQVRPQQLVFGEAAQTFTDYLVSMDPASAGQTGSPQVRVVSPRQLWSLLRVV